MKILITTDTYYPMTNGVVISTNNLYKELKLLGHDVRILTLAADGREYISGDVFYFSSYGLKIYPDARVIKPARSRIIREIINWGPDIIHSQTEFSTMIIAKYIKRKLNIPQVHTYHTMYEDYMHYVVGGRVIGKRALPRLTKLLLNTFDTVIAPTDKVKSKLQSYHVASNIEIIPTGIDITKFQRELLSSERDSLLEKYGLSIKDNILVYLGRIAEEKNIEEVIDLCDKAMKYVKNAKLLIVGGGPYLIKLKAMVKERGIEEYVKFTGMVGSDEVYKYYKLGDAFVTASTSETQGITYIEAIASSLPVICRWDMCVKDLIIKGHTGFTYENEKEFIDAVTSIFSDEVLKNKIISNLRAKVKDYSVETFGERVLGIYDTLVKEKYEHHTA